MIRHTFAALMMSVTAVTSAPAMAKEFNLAIAVGMESHYGAGSTAFKETFERLSDGAHTVTIRPAGMLGGEREVIEGLQIGTIELALSSTGPIGNFVPEVYALDFPFLFKNATVAREILDGEIGDELLAEFEKAGLIGLAWGENGVRQITNSVRPIRTTEDLQGLKLRTMENQVHIAAFEAAGAAPTPMSWPEVITSLRQGTIDGQENPISILVSQKLWETQKYVTLTSHVYSPTAMMMSKIHWDMLSDEEKGWFRQAARDAITAQRANVSAADENGVQIMRDHGMEVITEIDTEAFQKAVQPAYDQYAEKYGAEMIQRIRDAQK